MTIAEVSRKYDISADTLRYYERIGLIPPVPRTRGGLRDYGEESCGWIQLMKCMRAAGVQIEALIEYVDLFQQGDATLDARKALLVEQRDQLVSRMAEMQASLDLLNQKIDRYEQGSSAVFTRSAKAPERPKKDNILSKFDNILSFYPLLERFSGRLLQASHSAQDAAALEASTARKCPMLFSTSGPSRPSTSAPPRTSTMHQGCRT